MTQNIRQRLLLAAQVGVLVAQVVGLGIGVAAIVKSEASAAVAASTRSDTNLEASAYRDEIQARARIATWQTRLETMTDLDVRLNPAQNGMEQLAGDLTDHRG